MVWSCTVAVAVDANLNSLGACLIHNSAGATKDRVIVGQGPRCSPRKALHHVQ
jgi:hypothetical protein